MIAGYEEQLNDGNAGLELLIKVENSVAASPFWISGSLLTGKVAEAMGYQRVADSIRHAVENLLKRLPQIGEGRFKGGLSFLDARRQTVGRGEEQPLSGNVSNVAAGHTLPEWNALQTELDELYLEQGIAAVLETIERYQREAGSPRDETYDGRKNAPGRALPADARHDSGGGRTGW